MAHSFFPTSSPRRQRHPNGFALFAKTSPGENQRWESDFSSDFNRDGLEVTNQKYGQKRSLF
jgi:hypothetical protein